MWWIGLLLLLLLVFVIVFPFKSQGETIQARIRFFSRIVSMFSRQ